ncbi:unnamed protein product [Caenorhabditis nigoni]
MPKKKGAKGKKGAKEKKNNEESPRSIVNMQEKVSRTSRRSNAILKEKVSRTSGRSNVSNGSTEQGTPSASTLDSLELAENLSRQILSMQKVQNQLLDRISNMDLNQMQMATCLENFGLMFQEAAENKKLAEKSSQSVMDSKDQEGVVKMLESSSPVLQESENLSQPALGSVQQLTSPSTVLATNVISSIMSTITPFDEEAENFPLFRQMFEMMVHKNEDISVPLKQSLLMKLLAKDVLDMMKTPTISEGDYMVLLENLDRQYGNKENALQHYLTLLDQHSFSSDDFDAMEKDLNRFSSIVNVLKSNGSNPDDPFFIRLFVKKLPIRVMGSVYKRMLKGGQTFQDLVKVAYDTIREKKALEAARDHNKKCNRSEEVHTTTVDFESFDSD